MEKIHHHTKGILIQVLPGGLDEYSDRPEISKSQRTLDVPSSTLVYYHPARRIGPSKSVVVAGRVQIGDKLYANFNNLGHISDMAYIFVKFVDGGEQKLPRWTGFNTQLQNHDELQRSYVAYLSIIEFDHSHLHTHAM